MRSGRVPAEHAPVNARAKRYGLDTNRWLTTHESGQRNAPDGPREVIAWFHADGSAKVALLGIERSHEAWLALVERGVISPSEADPFIADLVLAG